MIIFLGHSRHNKINESSSPAISDHLPAVANLGVPLALDGEHDLAVWADIRVGYWNNVMEG